jgi:organic hydroperoxide reductase OsmC/OhrA
MGTFKTQLTWRRTTPDFRYESYDRNHTVVTGSGREIPCSAAPEFKGDGARANPEEFLVAALSSCHMLTFLAVAAKRKLVVESYDDDAEGTLEKNAAGKLVVAHVTLHPRVRFTSDVDGATLDALHRRAHEECFIANSVRTEVTVQSAV